jgi:hypothetical protein
LVQPLRLSIQTLSDPVREVARKGIELQQRLAAIAGHHLCCGRRRGGTQVGCKIHQGHVGFMPHPTDHWHRTAHHGAHHPFVIE